MVRIKSHGFAECRVCQFFITSLFHVNPAETVPGIGRNLPPGRHRAPSRVATYLQDDVTGLEPSGTFSVTEAEEYNPSLQLDFVGQPTVGVGADSYGSYVGGGATAYFSDMLGDQFLGVAFSAQGTLRTSEVRCST